MKIEILSFAGCPHREATVERTLEILSALGAEADVSEVEVRDGADAARLRFPALTARTSSRAPTRTPRMP